MMDRVQSSTYKTFITHSFSGGVIELTEPNMPPMKITAISLTTLKDRVIAPHAENSEDKAATDAAEIENSLGCLNILPSEIIVMVIRSMDIRSLAAFRNVNRYAKEMVDTVTKFKEVKDQAAFILRAVINLNPPLPTSIATLDAALLGSTCSRCGIRNGSIIFLLDCRRYCMICFCWNDDQDQYFLCGGGPGIWKL